MIPSEVLRRERRHLQMLGCKADRAEWPARMTFQSFICRREQCCRDMRLRLASGVLALDERDLS